MKSKIFLFSGAVCLLVALVLALCQIGTEYRAERLASDTLSALDIPETENCDFVPDSAMPQKSVSDTAYIGKLTFPSLGLSLPVAAECTDAALKVSPCRYVGSAYSDGLVIGGHNYRRQFGALGRLKIGDTVVFFDTRGNRFCYKVAEFQNVRATADAVTDGKWALTLFTCTATSDRAVRRLIHCERLPF